MSEPRSEGSAFSTRTLLLEPRSEGSAFSTRRGSGRQISRKSRDFAYFRKTLFSFRRLSAIARPPMRAVVAELVDAQR